MVRKLIAVIVAVAGLVGGVATAASAESRIRDTDMAVEMTAYTKSQILVQAGTAQLVDTP